MTIFRQVGCLRRGRNRRAPGGAGRLPGCALLRDGGGQLNPQPIKVTGHTQLFTRPTPQNWGSNLGELTQTGAGVRRTRIVHIAPGNPHILYPPFVSPSLKNGLKAAYTGKIRVYVSAS